LQINLFNDRIENYLSKVKVIMKLASYKGTRRGYKGLFNRLIRWWTNSIYSHNELIFNNGISASSSGSDGGVRFKTIEYDLTKWNIFTLDIPVEQQDQAWRWFCEHKGQSYDYLGLLGFVWRRGTQDKKKWFCNESIGASLGLLNPDLFTPGQFHDVMKEMYGKR
jgi:hypothetical protein